MAINPLAYAEKVVQNFLRYQLTTYAFADERLNRRMRELLSLDRTRETPLLKGPYVSLARAFAGGATVEVLVAEGIFHPHLRQLVPFPALYGHQEEAIRSIAGRRTTLISTGTGSGKSECFLYPIISRCLRLREERTPPGICAVLVYPMNALAEDQLGRLRDLLAGTGIPFGMYVGKTPEQEGGVTGTRLPAGASRADFRAALADARAQGRGATVHPAEELCSREAMRAPGGQPRLLLTNVNQLELLLTRERDVELFDDATLDFLVFDEAHTFSGAEGAETACLIRRLRSFCGKGANETVCIATSATIVDEEDPGAGRDFASRFFGVPRDEVIAVHERYEPDTWAETRSAPAPPRDLPASLRAVLAAVDAQDPERALREAWHRIAGTDLPAGRSEEALHTTLSRNDLLYELAQLLAEPRLLGDLLDDLGKAIGRPLSEEEIVLWLALAAAARKDERPLARPVAHVFLRGIPGAVVTFDAASDEPVLHLSAESEETGEEPNLRLRTFTCTTCGQHYFEHALADFEFQGRAPGGGEADGDRRLWRTLDLARGGHRIVLLDRLVSEGESDDDDGADLPVATIHLCRHCGAAHGEPGPCLQCGRSEPLVALQVVRQHQDHPGALTSCISCRSTGKPLGGRYREPIKPVRATNVADVHVLAQEMVEHAERKRLLLFADNRQDAAFQSGWMRDHARRYRFRSLVAEVLRVGDTSLGDLVFTLDQRMEGDDALSQALLPELWSVQAKDSAPKQHRDERRYLLRIQVLRELTAALKERIGLEAWGRLEVGYAGLSSASGFVRRWSARLELPTSELVEGIAAFLDILRRNRLVLDRNRGIYSRFWQEGDREIMDGYLQLPLMRGVPKALKLQRAPGDDPSRLQQWISPIGHLTLAAEIVRKWGVEPDRTAEFLEELWKHLASEPVGLLAPVTLQGSKGKALPHCGGAHQLDADKLRLRGHRGLWRCTTCRRRSVRSGPRQRCLAWHCKGSLEFVDEDTDNYDLQVLDEGYDLLRPREHTAMVPHDERERIEEIFKGESDTINTLVCTQTLELGVDIGSLDAVLMRNVPPLPANYWQRAGRAGRRHRMAVNLTYCRDVSHDRAYFAQPLKMLGGRVEPPSFNLSNGVMLAKHVRAAVLTRLHQLARRGSGLAEADQREVAEALRHCFPAVIRDYFFDDAGNVRSEPLDVQVLHTIITKHKDAIEETVDAAFREGWPAADAEVVQPARLAECVLGMTAELEAVLLRLDRRLRWALAQMTALEAIRQKQGTLDEEQEAFRRRCERLVKRYKGQFKGKPSGVEGLDDFVTYGVLAREGFLPGYGLEGGTVLGMAEVPRSAPGRDFDLPRPPAIALREYVPGNLIYANGQKFVARHYVFAADPSHDATRLEVIPERGAVRPASDGPAASLDARIVTSVPICDVNLVHTDRISDEEDNRFQMAVMVYGRELGRHDGGTEYAWGGRQLQHRRGVRLQLVNVGAKSTFTSEARLGYPVCLRCGQSVSPFSSEKQRSDFAAKHERWCGQQVAQIAFHADLAADALSLPACENATEAYSMAEALRFAATSVLDMDRDDLQVLVLGRPDSELLDAVLYDPMPGGSGLLDRICARFDDIVAEARRIAADCPGRCAASCVDCFQVYRNAFYHAHLDRHLMLARFEAWGDGLHESHQIPPLLGAAPSPGEGLPTNKAERKLRNMFAAAQLPPGRWQELRPLPKPLNSTTPDITYEDPDDPTRKIFVYLDGLSDGIHGRPETAQRDREIRAELRGEGHEVIEITAVELDDPLAMEKVFRKLARQLVGREQVDRVTEERDQWFAVRNEGVEDAPEGGTPAEGAQARGLPFTRHERRPTDRRAERCAPIYDLALAAGAFGEGGAAEPDGWAELDTGRTISPAMFVARVTGRSMQPTIPDGSWCLFTTLVGGSRDGRKLVIQLTEADPDTDLHYTIKEYRRRPEAHYADEEQMKAVILQPHNPDFQPLVLTSEQADQLRVIAEFLEIVG